MMDAIAPSSLVGGIIVVGAEHPCASKYSSYKNVGFTVSVTLWSARSHCKRYDDVINETMLFLCVECDAAHRFALYAFIFLEPVTYNRNRILLS
jgi:hypothetical protein